MHRSSLLGVDVSDSSIKVLQLNAAYEVIAFGSAPLSPGIVRDGLIVDIESFSKVVHALFQSTTPQQLSDPRTPFRAIISLPESKLFTHFVRIPQTCKAADIPAFVKADVEKIIPCDLNTLYWDSHVVEQGDVVCATFAGAPKEIIENYVRAFTRAGVPPALIGGQLFSLGYALLPQNLLPESYMILDIGARSTTIGMYSVDAIANSSIRIFTGGQQMTAAIESALHGTPDEAERLKRAYGVLAEHESTGVPAALTPILTTIVEGVREARVHFEQVTGRPVVQCIVAGGSALLPGIQQFFGAALGVTVTIADPLLRIKNPLILRSGTPEIFFANVIGLALCGVDARLSDINLLTQYRYEEGEAEKETLALADIRSLGDVWYVVYRGFARVRDRILSALQSLPPLRGAPAIVLTALALLCALLFLAWVLMTYL